MHFNFNDLSFSLTILRVVFFYYFCNGFESRDANVTVSAYQSFNVSVTTVTINNMKIVFTLSALFLRAF